MTDDWSNLAKIVYRRTYSRSDHGRHENWRETVARVIRGNTERFGVSQEERNRLEELLLQRKAMPAGRGLWFSGSPSHSRLGGAALNNCWFLNGNDWRNLVLAQDLLMLGGGVGFSIEKKETQQLPALKKNVEIRHESGTPAAFAVPDSREGWCELIHRVLEAHFVTGKSLTYSTHLIRKRGSPIRGFGGTAGGPEPLIQCVEKITRLLGPLGGRKPRPIQLLDLICMIGEMVVSGNVRRSALLILGDAEDAEYLQAKRWDLGTIPSHRAMANLSVVVDSACDLNEAFWATYENGEPYGLVNRRNLQTYGRMSEFKHDDAVGVNPCAEATLTHAEPCNLQEIFLPRLTDEKEFIEAARLMHRWGKRVTCESYHHPAVAEAVRKYRRIGTGITGCLQSPLFKPEILDQAYQAIQEENRNYSRELGIAESIRTTVIKPSGTLSLLGDCLSGIHPAYSRYYIRRVRFSTQDPLVHALKSAGHPMAPLKRLDGSLDPNTCVADFYCQAPSGAPIADESWDTFRQLEVVRLAQRHWSDQAVSVTVYYRAEDLARLKQWLNDHLSEIKTLSFLRHSDHGFEQAPLETITAEQYEKGQSGIRPIQLDEIRSGMEYVDLDCEGKGCPVR